MYQLNVMFDVLPSSLNELLRMNKHARNRYQKQWNDYVYLKVIRQRPVNPLQKCHIRIVRHYWRTLDYDGLVGSLKPVVDALRHAGVIADDTWNVTGAWEMSQLHRAKDLGPLVTVTVSEIE